MNSSEARLPMDSSQLVVWRKVTVVPVRPSDVPDVAR